MPDSGRQEPDVVALARFFKLDGESSADFLRGIKEMPMEERHALADEVRAYQPIKPLDS